MAIAAFQIFSETNQLLFRGIKGCIALEKGAGISRVSKGHWLECVEAFRNLQDLLNGFLQAGKQPGSRERGWTCNFSKGYMMFLRSWGSRTPK